MFRTNVSPLWPALAALSLLGLASLHAHAQDAAAPLSDAGIVDAEAPTSDATLLSGDAGVVASDASTELSGDATVDAAVLTPVPIAEPEPIKPEPIAPLTSELNLQPTVVPLPIAADTPKRMPEIGSV